jgi:hypothetical protein
MYSNSIEWRVGVPFSLEAVKFRNVKVVDTAGAIMLVEVGNDVVIPSEKGGSMIEERGQVAKADVIVVGSLMR